MLVVSNNRCRKWSGVWGGKVAEELGTRSSGPNRLAYYLLEKEKKFAFGARQDHGVAQKGIYSLHVHSTKKYRVKSNAYMFGKVSLSVAYCQKPLELKGATPHIWFSTVRNT